MIQINNLTPYQVEMLDHMWSLDTMEEFDDWYELLDEEDRQLADSLQTMVILATVDEMIDETNYKDAKEALKKFALQRQNMYNKTSKPRNPIAKDLRTPKYRMRTVESKVKYIRNPKHKKESYGQDV